MHRDPLPDHAVIANLNPAVPAVEGQVLREIAQHGVRMDQAARPQPGATQQADMRPQPTAGSDRDPRLDVAERSNFDTQPQLRSGRDDSGGVNPRCPRLVAGHWTQGLGSHRVNNSRDGF